MILEISYNSSCKIIIVPEPPPCNFEVATDKQAAGHSKQYSSWKMVNTTHEDDDEDDRGDDDDEDDDEDEQSQ